jgi:hypothetical protein
LIGTGGIIEGLWEAEGGGRGRKGRRKGGEEGERGGGGRRGRGCGILMQVYIVICCMAAIH